MATETESESITTNPDGTTTITQSQSQTEPTFSLQEQAALALRLPASGTDWLDAMIMSARLFERYCDQKLSNADLLQIEQAGADAWCQSNGIQWAQALALCQDLAKSIRPAA